MRLWRPCWKKSEQKRRKRSVKRLKKKQKNRKKQLSEPQKRRGPSTAARSIHLGLVAALSLRPSKRCRTRPTKSRLLYPRAQPRLRVLKYTLTVHQVPKNRQSQVPTLLGLVDAGMPTPLLFLLLRSSNGIPSGWRNRRLLLGTQRFVLLDPVGRQSRVAYHLTNTTHRWRQGIALVEEKKHLLLLDLVS